jgi:hypothetical protein
MFGKYNGFVSKARVSACMYFLVPWFQRFIFIIFIAKGRGKINLWNQGNFLV